MIPIVEKNIPAIPMLSLVDLGRRVYASQNVIFVKKRFIFLFFE